MDVPIYQGPSSADVSQALRLGLTTELVKVSYSTFKLRMQFDTENEGFSVFL